MKMKIIIKDRIGMQAKYTPNLLVDSEKKKKNNGVRKEHLMLFSYSLLPCTCAV